MSETDFSISGIYAITNKFSGKRYIGSAANIRRRYADHVKLLRKGKHHSVILQRAWIKYGEHAFSLSILEPVGELTKLIEREQAWLDAEGQIGFGYNASPTAGSPLGVKHSPTARANMSVAAKSRAPDPERIEKMRKANLGKKHTPETIEKIRASKIGIKRPREAIDKMMIAREGWKPSPEHAEKLRTARLGRKNSPESIAKQLATKAAKKLLLAQPN